MTLAHVTCPGSDEIVLDCNGNGADDYCDITVGTSADANTNAIPDECDFETCDINLWGGFQPNPPWMNAVTVHGVDFDGDGDKWDNPSGSWTTGNGGCPVQGKRIQGGVSDVLPPPAYVVSEFFHTDEAGLLECTSAKYTFTADFKLEATLTPKIDWQISIHSSVARTKVKDPVNDPAVILIHLPSTRSTYAGVQATQRGRVLVQNPAGSPAFINTGQVEALNQCVHFTVELDNNAPAGQAVNLTVGTRPPITLARLDAEAIRMNYFYIQQVANGQTSGGTHRMAMDSVTVCESGMPLDWLDCNGNCVDDAVDLAEGTSQDCAASIQGVPDECETDCNTNGIPDLCDIAAGTSRDCNTNAQPDDCDIAAGASLDCNGNGTPEECDLASGTSPDCNVNGTADNCDLLLGTSGDCNGNLMPDDCDVASGASPDCNSNQIPDECDVAEVSLDWRLRPTLGPRVGHAMVYDAARRTTVLFGGEMMFSLYAHRYFSDTWGWDGIQWNLLAASGPLRSGHALAYDSGRAVTVLFGGGVGTTWEWDGASWHLRSESGPSSRSHHAMTYDSARGVTVLFGGHGSDLTNSETWEWDGASWMLRSTGGPAPRYGHAMAYDSIRGVSVLFGGLLEADYYDGETWEWDGASWSLRSTAGPAPAAYAMSYDEARGVCVLLGSGTGPGQPMQTWEWDGMGWTPRSADGPVFRRGHVMVYDSARGATVMYGGSDFEYPNGGEFGDTWTWDGAAWTLAASGEPSIRSQQSFAMAYDIAREVSVVVVSSDTHSEYCQTAEWDGGSWKVSTPSGLLARSGYALAYDSVRGVSVLFGGFRGGLNDETWEWDGDFWALRGVAGPSPRSDHSLAYDSARGVTVLFGGTDADGPNGETWEYDGAAWILRADTGPSPSSNTTMAYDSARGVTVLIAGGETWEWEGTAWAFRSTFPWGYYSSGKMAYDSGRGVTVLPVSFRGFRQTWEWDGIAWTSREVSTAPFAAAMAYDSARRAMVLFNERVWEFGTRSFDCNADGVPDECTARDCNSNGVPDSCETLPPCARIIAAASWRTHGGGVGRDAIAINTAGRAGSGGVTSESRIGGISELRLTFDTAPAASGSPPITLAQRTCGDSGAFVLYAGPASASASIQADEIVVHFTPSLENARTYRLSLAPQASAVPGQSIEVRCLAGDVNSDGRVNSMDRSGVVAAWSGAGYSPATDITLDGRTESADRGVVVSIWTGLDNCAP